MKILALDQATKTGFAYYDGKIMCGLWDLSAVKEQGKRLRRLLRRMDTMKKTYGVDLVVFESFGQMFGHAKIVLPALRGAIELWCYDNEVPTKIVTPKAVKKHATGNGNSKKDKMFVAAKQKWPNLSIIDDNVADALWILDYAMNDNAGTNLHPKFPSPHQDKG